MKYEAKIFDIPVLEGISERTIEEHLGLYAGYVKHVNLIHEKIEEMKQDSEKNAYALAEVQRRLGFEFGGMKNHEAYFGQFEGGAKALDPESELAKSLAYLWGSVDDFLAHFRVIAMTRGVGWAMLYLDRSAQRLVTTWVDEQHIGQFTNVEIILGLDMWEHSYMLDYAPSEKKQYVDAFFKNLNWEVVANRVV
jgi:Fe-Mn family superoxide dismutase